MGGRPLARLCSAGCRLLLVVVALVLCCPAGAAAQSGWSVQFAGERSAVTVDATDTVWSSQILTLGFTREAAGGWRASVERQARGDASDLVFTTGGYRRMGDWTIGGTAAGSSDASFWFSKAFDAELSRRLVGTVVGSVAYRYMDFAVAGIHQVQPAVTWYNPRGEVQARLYVTRNTTRDQTSSALLLRTTTRLTSRVGFNAAYAVGDRIFDVASLAYGPASSWTLRGALMLYLTRRDAFELGAGYAREDPSFTQRTFTFSYRRAF